MQKERNAYTFYMQACESSQVWDRWDTLACIYMHIHRRVWEQLPQDQIFVMAASAAIGFASVLITATFALANAASLSMNTQ